jgi:hypothetical protein
LETEIDFSLEPYSGTFEVTEGAEILGCVSGSFVDTMSASGDFKELTCESGERSGTTGNFTNILHCCFTPQIRI